MGWSGEAGGAHVPGGDLEPGTPGVLCSLGVEHVRAGQRWSFNPCSPIPERNLQNWLWLPGRERGTALGWAACEKPVSVACSHTSHCCAVTGYLFTSLVRFPSSPEFSPSVPSLCSSSLLFFRATMKCASSLLLLLVSLVAPVPGLSPWGRVAPELGIGSWNN